MQLKEMVVKFKKNKIMKLVLGSKQLFILKENIFLNFS